MKKFCSLLLCLSLAALALTGCGKKPVDPSVPSDPASTPSGQVSEPAGSSSLPGALSNAPSLAEAYNECLALYDTVSALAAQNGWDGDEKVKSDLSSIKQSLDTTATIVGSDGGGYDENQQAAMAIFLKSTILPILTRVQEQVSAPAQP